MSGTRVLYIGLDACDLRVAQQFARDGDMPTLARLLAEGAVQETIGPLGFLVGANWPTIYTGTTPTRHQFLCSGQVRGDTYEPRWLAPLRAPAIWDHVSRAGGRVAVLDAPHAAVREELNGVQLVEWGCHDRHAGTRSYPSRFRDEIDATYGPHLLGELDVPFPHCAPCDIAHRAGTHRTLDENRALLDDLLEAHRRKLAVTRDLLESDRWDLVFSVFGESHCTGHQFWKFHDPTHPWHDAAMARELGDPLRHVYTALDSSLGQLLEVAGPEAIVYVHLSHGMRSHFDGTFLLDTLLWRLDEYASGVGERGPFTRATDVVVGRLPRAARSRALRGFTRARRCVQSRTGPISDTRDIAIPEWMGQRRWWMQPNDSAYGSVRLNVQGREPNGRIAKARKRDAELWLADRLHELVNVDTGEPAVAAVFRTDENYERAKGDAFGDLIVEWNRDAPIDTVWSPATAVVSAPYRDWRSGDHHRGGLLLSYGRGIEAGRRAGSMSVVDVAPTIAAALALDVPSFDGVARGDLVPNGSSRHSVRAPESVAVRPSGHRRWSPNFDVHGQAWIETYSLGLAGSHHHDHLQLERLSEEVAQLQNRVRDLDRLAQVAQVTAWLRHIDVPESSRVSVVMPTRNRARLVERAIASVRAQTYPHWELLVVDDGSTDDTWGRLERLAHDDARIRPFRLPDRGRSSTARNHALEHAKGDVIAYLDDDNRFDPDWLRAVVWAFNEFPETQVCYGARVIDDDARHRGLAARSMPVIQFNEWDRDAMLRSNLVDQNVVAHRPSPVRFDPEIDHFSDWDVLLQLTDDSDPLALPVIATHYYSDGGDRLSVAFAESEFVATAMARIRARTLERRACE